MATALGVVPLSACGDDTSDAGPPRIVDLEFLDSCTLQVTFSEPMAEPIDVDPDIFRLSAAFHRYGQTEYYDLGIHFDGSPDEDAPPPKEIPSARGTPRHFIADFIDLQRDEEDHRVMRLLNQLEINAVGACEALEEAEDAALLLHYSDFWEPRVTDKSGQPLEDIGSHWVRSLAFKVEVGEYPNMPDLLPIPCPKRTSAGGHDGSM